jgi:acetyl esterase/lipase
MPITRRDLLAAGTAMGAGLLFPHHSTGQSASSPAATHAYKTVGNLTIKADVYGYQDVFVRPAVVWIHGGALIMGHRGQIDGRVKEHMLEKGYVLISVDYRLAPETPLPAIIQDLTDAFEWIRRDGSRLFHIDPARIAVAGGSAGGYLTLVSGYRVRPRPTVLLSLWGYGDVIGDWYSKPSPHSRHRQSNMTREEAFQQVSGAAIADSREREGDGGAFYQYCRQTGTWPKAVTGWDPVEEPERFYPFMPVKNVTAQYPPTVMIHGTSDTDVPHEQSIMMAEQFKRRRVPHLMISIAGGEHGLAGGEPEQIDAAYAKGFAFVDEHLKSK